MPTPQVLPLTDAESGYKFEDSEQGSSGVKAFYVDTPDPVEALAAAGIPQIGASWSATEDAVTCRRRETQVMTGAKPDATFTTTTGWTKVTAHYATSDLNTGGGSLPPEARAPGSAYSEYEFSDGTTTIKYDINGAAVNGDEGATVESASLELRVRQFVPEAPSPTVFLNLLNSVNSNALTFPPPYGSTAPLSVGVGQALFRTPKITVTTDNVGEPIVEVTWRFGLAPDWLVRWRKFDADGNPVGDIIESQVYPAKNWGSIP